MKKTIIFILVLIIVISIGIFVAIKINDNNKTETTNQDNVVNQNSDIVDDKENETIEDNIIQDNAEEDNSTNEETSDNQDEINDDTQILKNDEEKAIEIAKKTWGTDSTVYFSFDHTDETGNYIIAVRDANTTRTLEWYIVNVETGSCITK